MQWLKKSERLSVCTSKSDPLENREKKAKKKAVVKAVERILWKDCVWK